MSERGWGVSSAARSYVDGTRAPDGVTNGIVLAGVLCIPWLRTLGQVPRRAVVPADGLWFVMLLVITVYGFGG
jgi:hypothetical protein